jgi:nicotinate phosphoribosyltransferase
MAFQALCARLQDCQKAAFHGWLQEYDNKLGIALTDTYGLDAFLRDFGFVLATAFEGVRHDSGCPYEFGRRMIEHYESLGIDPRTKKIVFSDGLSVEKAIRLFEEFTGRIGLAFGIGTNLTNDVGFTPLNIVIKMWALNGINVVKLGEGLGKEMGEAGRVVLTKGAMKVAA